MAKSPRPQASRKRHRLPHLTADAAWKIVSDHTDDFKDILASIQVFNARQKPEFITARRPGETRKRTVRIAPNPASDLADAIHNACTRDIRITEGAANKLKRKHLQVIHQLDVAAKAIQQDILPAIKDLIDTNQLGPSSDGTDPIFFILSSGDPYGQTQETGIHLAWISKWVGKQALQSFSWGTKELEAERMHHFMRCMAIYLAIHNVKNERKALQQILIALDVYIAPGYIRQQYKRLGLPALVEEYRRLGPDAAHRYILGF